jgi:hypothetical protein
MNTPEITTAAEESATSLTMADAAEQLSEVDPLKMFERGMMRGVKNGVTEAQFNDLVNRTVAGLKRRHDRRKANKQAKASRKRNRK